MLWAAGAQRAPGVTTAMRNAVRGRWSVDGVGARLGGERRSCLPASGVPRRRARRGPDMNQSPCDPSGLYLYSQREGI